MTTPTDIMPAPFFEGSEKRIEVDFANHRLDDSGLRKLTRAQLDEITTLAACTIISSASSEYFDEYVLSESSLFVYPTKLVMKTCGTTKLLACVPRLLEMSSALDMHVLRMKFTRASYLAPEKQLNPHTCFTDELVALHCCVQRHGLHEEAYVLGDAANRLQWHVYVASAPTAACLPPVCTFEVCMIDLDPVKAAQFVRTDQFVSAAETTKATGIKFLLPNAEIDDYVFEPCGYSMNGMDKEGFMTIHITPEDGFSYASVELHGFAPAKFCPSMILSEIVKIFQPGQMCVSMSMSHLTQDNYSWGASLSAPKGYSCKSGLCQELATGGRVVFYNLSTAVEATPSVTADAVMRDGLTETGSSDSEDDMLINQELGYRSSSPDI